MTARLLRTTVRARHAMVRRLGRAERGDVPGWVMITLMTAGLVAILWGVAQDQLTAMFQRAMDRVNGA
jgi:hypothetical protein